MKISEFSNKSNVSEQTIRFYIKKGLLIPLHTSYQYSFSEQDLKDLRYIQSCKRMGFSLEETLRILSLHRVASLHGPKEAAYLLDILRRKRDELEKTQEVLKASIQELSRSIEECQLKISNPVRASGMPRLPWSLHAVRRCYPKRASPLREALLRMRRGLYHSRRHSLRQGSSQHPGQFLFQCPHHFPGGV